MKDRLDVRGLSLAGLFMLVLATGGPAVAQQRTPTPPVDPEAVKLLRRMTDHLGGLEQFSVRTRNLREDLLESGHRVDFELSVSVTVSRPNKVRTERLGHLEDQAFYYDGRSLTVYNGSHKMYARAAAPSTIEETIDFARESLGVVLPVADLVYRNAFP